MDKTREEAWIQYIKTNPTKPSDKWAFMQAFDAGAASVDRVAIVREAFEEARRIMRAGWCNGSMAGNAAEEAMDAVLADMEKEKC